MKKLINVLVFAIGALILSASIGYVFGYDKTFVRDALAILGIFLTIAWLLFFLLKSKTTTKTIGGFLFGDLQDSIENFLNELPKPNNKTVASLSYQLIYRLTRVGLIGLLVTCIPIWLLYSQNKLVSSQTELLESQNNKIDQQNLLQEASRRNTLQFEISSVLDLLDRELKDDYGKNIIRDISPELQGRIIALNSRLRAYYFIEGRTMIDKPLSPERGQLVISLINSRLERLALKNILSKMDLRSADFRNAIITDVSLDSLRFYECDFTGSELSKVNLSGSQFEDVTFNRVTMEDCNLQDAIVVKGEWTKSTFKNVNFNNADLFNSDWQNNYFEESSFYNTQGHWLMLNNSVFSNVRNLGEVDPRYAFSIDLTECILVYTNEEEYPEEVFERLIYTCWNDTRTNNIQLLNILRKHPDKFIVDSISTLKWNNGVDSAVKLYRANRLY